MSSSQINVDGTIGATLIGFAVSCVVFGVLTMQVFTYFQRYPSDRPAYKMLVALIWSLEVVDQVFIGHSVYYYSISNFGSPLVLVAGEVVWSMIVQVVSGVLVGTIVKACFAMRVWRFSSKNIFITLLILAIDFGQLGLGIAYAVKGFQIRKFSDVSDLSTVASLALGSGMITDAIIAVSLCFYLRKLRTGYEHSDSLVNRLTIYAINTGVLTSAISLSTLVLYNMTPDKLYFLAVYFVLSKIYAISFMCTLNTRKIIRAHGTDRDGGVAGTQTAQVHGQSFRIVNNAVFSVNGKHGKSAWGNPSRGTDPMTSEIGVKSVEIGVHQEVSVVSDHERERETGFFDSEEGRVYTLRGY